MAGPYDIQYLIRLERFGLTTILCSPALINSVKVRKCPLHQDLRSNHAVVEVVVPDSRTHLLLSHHYKEMCVLKYAQLL
jgi:hypothetical protein